MAQTLSVKCGPVVSINFRLFCCQEASSIPAERRGRAFLRLVFIFLPSLLWLDMCWPFLISLYPMVLSCVFFLCYVLRALSGPQDKLPIPVQTWHTPLAPCAEPASVFHRLSSGFTDALSLEWTCSLVPTHVQPASPRRVSVCPVGQFCPLCLSWVFGGFFGSPALTPSSPSPAFS